MKKNTLEAVFRTETGICIFGWWIPIYRTTHYDRGIDLIEPMLANKLQESKKTDES